MNELRRRTTADTLAARDVDTIFINQHLLDTIKPRGKYSGIHKKIIRLPGNNKSQRSNNALIMALKANLMRLNTSNARGSDQAGTLVALTVRLQRTNLISLFLLT